jgi:hypothetical protein
MRIAFWQCECGRVFVLGLDAFLHRRDCAKNCYPVAESDLPLKRLSGIEREQMEADYDA